MLFRPAAHEGMASLMETMALLLNERGMTLSTYRRRGTVVRHNACVKPPPWNTIRGLLTMNLALGLFARTVCTILV